MTQYRLTALEWWQEVDRTRRCPECGTASGDEDVQKVRHREGDIVDVDGADEARLLAAGALGPVTVEAAAVPEAVDEVAPVADTPPAAVVAGEVRRPPQVASKADWVAYVVAAGILTDAEAEELTKLELIEIAK